MKNKKELCGKVYCPELNYCGYPKILERNIFDLNGPMNASLYELRNYTDKKEFETQLAKEIRYELGSRSEYECYLDTAFNKDESKILKIDPYKQVEMNGEQFVNYCGENRKLFGGERFKKANRRLKELRKYGRSLK